MDVEGWRSFPQHCMILVHEHIAGIDCVYYGWFKLSYRVVCPGISDPAPRAKTGERTNAETRDAKRKVQVSQRENEHRKSTSRASSANAPSGIPSQKSIQVVTILT